MYTQYVPSVNSINAGRRRSRNMSGKNTPKYSKNHRPKVRSIYVNENVKQLIKSTVRDVMSQDERRASGKSRIKKITYHGESHFPVSGKRNESTPVKDQKTRSECKLVPSA